VQFIVVFHPLVFEEHGCIPEAAGGEFAPHLHASHDCLSFAEEVVSRVLCHHVEQLHVLLQLAEEVLDILLAVAVGTLDCLSWLEQNVVREARVACFDSISPLLGAVAKTYLQAAVACLFEFDSDQFKGESSGIGWVVSEYPFEEVFAGLAV